MRSWPTALKIASFIALVFLGAFLYWTVAPLFINKQVDDALPKSLLLPQNNEPIELTASTTGETTDTNVLRNEIFPITNTPGHPATGKVRVIETPKQQLIRFEDYDGTNGPDLFIYQAKDLEAEEFVSLGRAQGNQGNINYEVPAEVSLSEYTYVMTWCRTFGVLFDYAKIN